MSDLLSKHSKSYPHEETLRGKSLYYGPMFKSGYDIVLSCNDVMRFVESMPSDSVSLVVTSPPYNIGKPYEKRVEFGKYLEWQSQVIKECVRVLKPNGSVCWEVGNYIENGEVFPLDTYFYDIFKAIGLKLRNRIIWTFGHGLHASLRFSGRYEVILWFTKGDSYRFNLDAVRVPQKYPGKTAYKGKNRGKPTANPLGKNPSDIWDMLVAEWEEQVWNIPNVKSNHPEKTIHPSQFPIELVQRLTLALTNEGETVFDPFVGVGQSLIAALLDNRKGIGVDKERMYTDLALQRIKAAINGRLKRRTLGTQVWVPKGTEKVARPPAEWATESMTKYISSDSKADNT